MVEILFRRRICINCSGEGEGISLGFRLGVHSNVMSKESNTTRSTQFISHLTPIELGDTASWSSTIHCHVWILWPLIYHTYMWSQRS